MIRTARPSDVACTIAGDEHAAALVVDRRRLWLCPFQIKGEGAGGGADGPWLTPRCACLRPATVGKRRSGAAGGESMREDSVAAEVEVHGPFQLREERHDRVEGESQHADGERELARLGVGSSRAMAGSCLWR